VSTPSNPNPSPAAAPMLDGLRRFGILLARLSRPTGLILALAWYGLIFALSSRTALGRPGPITGSWLLNTGHALLFGLLGLWLAVALPRRGGWPFVARQGVTLIMGSVLSLGMLDELHQASVPGRTLSAADVLTDLTGAACVLWICAFVGSAAASERGLRWRLALALGACSAAGGLATLSDNTFG
jgi:VanZ family protein